MQHLRQRLQESLPWRGDLYLGSFARTTAEMRVGPPSVSRSLTSLIA